MKNLTLLLALFLFFSCNNDDDIIIPPVLEPEPLIANAKILMEGACGDNHFYLEIYNISPDSVETGRPLDFFTFLDIPEAFQVEDLEVFIDYRNIENSEFVICPTLGPSRHRFILREILLPTE